MFTERTVPVQKYLRERRYHVLSHDYSPAMLKSDHIVRLI